MAHLEPACTDSEWQLLSKILSNLNILVEAPSDVGPIAVQDEGTVITPNLVTLNFTGAGVTATAIGQDVTVDIPGGGSGSNLQSGTQLIIGLMDTVTVVFPVAFLTVPDVVITVSRPLGENMVYANIDLASLTVTGFTASLSGNVASPNYSLHWMANE